MKSFFLRKRLRRSMALAAGLLATQPLHSEIPRHVVLIHGIWDTFKTMRKMESVLREAGFEPLVISLTPNGGQRPLDDLGKQVDLQIRNRIPESARFSIIGFSMGGLVARSYLRQFGDPARVATFISIASPHHGTWLAWLDGNPGVRDMRPGSAFLSAIDADASRFSRNAMDHHSHPARPHDSSLQQFGASLGEEPCHSRAGASAARLGSPRVRTHSPNARTAG